MAAKDCREGRYQEGDWLLLIDSVNAEELCRMKTDGDKDPRVLEVRQPPHWNRRLV
jgi:hypothetical protein